MATKRVIFLCVENSCRSQIAEAFARRGADAIVEVFSAGSRPAGRVHPTAVALLEELGIDVANQSSKGLDALPPVEFDLTVTMGCGDNCPALRAKRREDWVIPDPKNMPLAEARAVRDEIRTRVEAVMREIVTDSPAGHDGASD